MNKSIRSPRFLSYPITVIESYVSEDMSVEHGQNLFVVKDQDGTPFTITSKMAGKVEALYFAYGMPITVPSILCEISEPVQAHTRDFDAETKPQTPPMGDVRDTFQKAEPEPTARRSYRFPLLIVTGYWILSMILLFWILFPITAEGRFFWEHIIFPIGLGVIPLLTISTLMRRMTYHGFGQKTPRSVVLALMVFAYYPLAFVTSETDEIKSGYAADANDYLADLGHKLHFTSILGTGGSDGLNRSEKRTVRQQIEYRMAHATDALGSPSDPQGTPRSVVFRGLMNAAILEECAEKGLISDSIASDLGARWLAFAYIGKEYLNEDSYDNSFQSWVETAEFQFEVVYEDNLESLNNTCGELVEKLPVEYLN